MRHACGYWREQAKAGDAVDGRIINTSSGAGIFGNFGQTNYGAAKMGLVGFTRVLAVEGAKNNIKANAIAPVARTRMTEDLLGPLADGLLPENVTPIVAYIYLPFFRQLDVTSAYEYLEKRFNLAARWFGSASFRNDASNRLMSTPEERRTPVRSPNVTNPGCWTYNGADAEDPRTRCCTSGSVSPVATSTPFRTRPRSVAPPVKKVAIVARVRNAAPGAFVLLALGTIESGS